ncbi:hypothetical protein CEXT_396011 [Caerostris extrusa]|uniref:Uncharacterized protein n=1 Tax=Caerostris extrusa TaxID=172846 RepID=A0AAV4VKA7_CAEEX|nr:hypothetical protein CEXT_396011 [Caerostris extrusa]
MGCRTTPTTWRATLPQLLLGGCDRVPLPRTRLPQHQMVGPTAHHLLLHGGVLHRLRGHAACAARRGLAEHHPGDGGQVLRDGLLLAALPLHHRGLPHSGAKHRPWLLLHVRQIRVHPRPFLQGAALKEDLTVRLKPSKKRFSRDVLGLSTNKYEKNLGLDSLVGFGTYYCNSGPNALFTRPLCFGLIKYRDIH